MKIPEHLALSYLLAQFGVHQHYGPTGTALMLVAGMLPDLDGVSILGGWNCHRKYHRVLGHGILVTLFGPALLALFAVSQLGFGYGFWLWLWLQVALLLHLATDLVFYGWPVQLLWPFSRGGVGLARIAWNDLIPTLLLYLGSALVYVRPALAAPISACTLTALMFYMAWRSRFPRPRTGWLGWLTGDWARRSPRVCLWLTGDFITR
jgi:membrane-bound metal-dependent hydrolase YbcI (DUF457 family)